MPNQNASRVSYYLMQGQAFLPAMDCYPTGRVVTFHQLPMHEWNCPDEYPSLPKDPIWNRYQWWNPGNQDVASCKGLHGYVGLGVDTPLTDTTGAIDPAVDPNAVPTGPLMPTIDQLNALKASRLNPTVYPEVMDIIATGRATDVSTAVTIWQREESRRIASAAGARSSALRTMNQAMLPSFTSPMTWAGGTMLTLGVVLAVSGGVWWLIWGRKH